VGGVAVAVDDEDLIESVQNLSRFDGMFAEPTGASSVASLKIKEKGILKESDTVICMVTGSGFKDAYTVEEYVEIPPTELEPNLKEVENFLERKLT